jgi:hypothetical protein
LKFNDYCMIKKDNISEALCVEITAELSGLKKEDVIKDFLNNREKTKEDLHNTCKQCINYPF